MSIQSFDERMEKACKNLEVPGAILAATDKDGKYRYEKAFGQRSLKTSKPDPMKLDGCLWMASCTKLVTTIAAMQCVERGQLKLDDDVTNILHELKGIKILTGFNEETGEPNLVENTKIITLRHLLTHSSGLSYDIFNPVLMQYRKWENKMDPSLKAIRPLPQAILFPLLFAPGDAWEYSVGIDWAGQMVERVNDNISLEDYMHKNIWGPLGVQNFTFHPKSAPHVLERMIDMNEREGGINPIFSIAASPDGKVGYTDNTIWNWETPGCHGGAGSFGNMLDYQKMLHSICSDDGKLLKSSTIDEMFTPQLSSASRESLLQKLAIPELNQLYGGMPLGVKVDWGLGGQMLMEDLKGERRKGTMVWGGYPNLIWFCDRFGGMSGIYGSQLNPPGDLKTVELVTAWIKELYSKAGKAKL